MVEQPLSGIRRQPIEVKHSLIASYVGVAVILRVCSVVIRKQRPLSRANLAGRKFSADLRCRAALSS